MNAPVAVASGLCGQGFRLTVEGALTQLEEKRRQHITAERVPA